MTLDELRKLRDAMYAADDTWTDIPQFAEGDQEAYEAYRLATNVYEVAAVEYVNELLDAMPKEGK